MDDANDDDATAFSLALGSLECWSVHSSSTSATRLRSLATACSPRELLVALAGEASRAEPSAARTAALCEGLWACLTSLSTTCRTTSIFERHIETALDAVATALHGVGRSSIGINVNSDDDDILIAVQMAATLTTLSSTALLGHRDDATALPQRVASAALRVAAAIAATSLCTLGPPALWEGVATFQRIVAFEAAVTTTVRASSTHAETFFSVAAVQARRMRPTSTEEDDGDNDAATPSSMSPHMSQRDIALLALFSDLAARVPRSCGEEQGVDTAAASISHRLANAKTIVTNDSIAAASRVFIPRIGSPLCSDVISPLARLSRLLVLLPPLAREASTAASLSGQVVTHNDIDIDNDDADADADADGSEKTAHSFGYAIVFLLNQALATLPQGKFIEAHFINTGRRRTTMVADDDSDGDDDAQAPDAALLQSLVILSAQSPTQTSAVQACRALCAVLRSSPPIRRSLLYASLAGDCPFHDARALIHSQASADASAGIITVSQALTIWHAGIAGRLREGLLISGGSNHQNTVLVLTALRNGSDSDKTSVRAYLEARRISDTMLMAFLRGVLLRAHVNSENPVWKLPIGASRELAVVRDSIIIPLIQAAVLVELSLLEAAVTPLIEILDLVLGQGKGP